MIPLNDITTTGCERTVSWLFSGGTPTLFLSTQEAEKLSQPQWPENGDVWSDGEDGTNMDCGLLQAMAEEDEEINVYNEETFGMGV